jgi:hypothetical protein
MMIFTYMYYSKKVKFEAERFEKLKVKMLAKQAKSEGAPKKKSKFQERLEEMQRKSIEMQKNSKKK